MPNSGANSLTLGKFEPDYATTDGKFITNYGAD